MARFTYVISPTKEDGPLLRVRNAARRNQRRLGKRVRRFEERYGDCMRWTTDSGTLVVVPVNLVRVFTVKRDAMRAAKRLGRQLLTL